MFHFSLVSLIFANFLQAVCKIFITIFFFFKSINIKKNLLHCAKYGGYKNKPCCPVLRNSRLSR